MGVAVARERDHFATAHSALAAYAAAGRFGWGRPLTATTLASELGLSPTPVREALAHLAGEGVIEHRAGRGYFAPSLTASDVTGLYDLHRQYLVWSMLRPQIPISVLRNARSSDIGRVEEVFSGLVLRGGNEAVGDAYRRLTHQLRPVRRVEKSLDALGLEIIDGLQVLIDDGHDSEVTRRIDQYHSQKSNLATTIEMVMRQSA